jgi:hypothetical protein
MSHNAANRVPVSPFVRAVLALCICAAASACTGRNPAFCTHGSECASGRCNLATNACVLFDAGVDGPNPHCSDDLACATSPGTPYCVNSVCVACRDTGDCTGGNVCNASAHTCGACSNDTQCDFGGRISACIAGKCPPGDHVLWVDCAADAGGDGSRDLPLADLTSAATMSMGTDKYYIVMQPHPIVQCSYHEVDIKGNVLDIDGRGAFLTARDGAPGLHVEGHMTDVTVRNLDISFDATFQEMGTTTPSAADGVYVTDAKLTLDGVAIHDMGNYQVCPLLQPCIPEAPQRGINAFNAGSISVYRSLIYRNTYWGIDLSGSSKFTISDTFVVVNGSTRDTGLTAGGVRIRDMATGEFEFNTVALNSCLTGGCGVTCVSAANLENSLLLTNDVTLPTSMTVGQCAINEGSLVGLTAADAPDYFVDPSMPELTPNGGGFHLKVDQVTQNNVIGKGFAIANPPTDYDGDTRPATPNPPTPGADEPNRKP